MLIVNSASKFLAMISAIDHLPYERLLEDVRDNIFRISSDGSPVEYTSNESGKAVNRPQLILFFFHSPRFGERGRE